MHLIRFPLGLWAGEASLSPAQSALKGMSSHATDLSLYGIFFFGPRPSVGELTALPKSPRWILGSRTSKRRERKERGKDRGGEEEEGRKGKEGKGDESPPN